MQIQTVVVIGAGASGLQSARALLKRGRSQVLILEQGGAVGGVWTKPYLSSVQVPHSFYEFAEFPWPAHLLQDAKQHPSSQAVQAYAQAYAEHFGLIQHIRFHCQVLRLQPAPQGGWAVIYLDQASGLFQVVAADYVVVATGMYCVPNVPVYKGMQHFRGLQLHANDFTDPALLAGKRVVVVGSGRSALDCASMVAASQQAAKVTWLFRQAHWPIPQQIAPGLSMQRFLFSRLPSLLLPPYYTATASQQGMHRLSAQLKSSMWKWLQSSIVQQFGLKGGMLPALSLQQDLLYYGLVVDAAWNRVLLHRQAGTVRHSSRPDSSSVSKCFEQLLQQDSRLSCGASSNEVNSRSSSSLQHGEQLYRSKSCWWGKLRSRRQLRRTASAGATSNTAVCAYGTVALPPVAENDQAQQQQQQSSSSQPPATGIADGVGSNMKLDTSRAGSVEIQTLCGEIERFGRDCLLLRSGGAVSADVVLYCTGYNKSYDYLDSEPRGRLGLQKDGLPLYRHILPPLVPGLAFIGCEASSYNTLLTAGLQAEWLAAVLDGQVGLPEVEAMQDDVRRMTAWMRNVFPAHRHRASAVQLYMAHYHAQLLQDMQLPSPRHTWVLQPLTSHDYSFAFRLPLGTPVQGNSDSPVQDEACERGMDSVAAATEQAQRRQQSFTAVQLSSAAAVAEAMTPTGLAGGLLQRSRADSPAADSAVVIAPAGMGLQWQEEQQRQERGPSCTNIDEQVRAAFPEQSVLMAAAIPVEDDATAGADISLEVVAVAELAALKMQQREQHGTQEAQPRSRSVTPTTLGVIQCPVEWCQQLQQQQQDPQQESLPVSSSVNTSIQARADSTAIWSGSNAWFSPCSQPLNAAKSTVEGEQESMGTFGEGRQGASYTARVLFTSTIDSSSNSACRCSDRTGGGDSTAIAAAASGGCKHHRLLQVRQYRPLAPHLQQPAIEAVSVGTEVSSSLALLPAPSTPKLLLGMASLPVGGSSRASLAAATEFAASATSKHYDMLHRSSSSGCTAARRVSSTSSGLRRSSSMAALAAAAAIPGGFSSSCTRQLLLQHHSRSCGSCAAVDESAVEETVKLTEQTAEQQEQDGDDRVSLVLPEPFRQNQAVQRWLDSLPAAVTSGETVDPDYFERRPPQARRHSSAQSLGSSRSHGQEERQRQQRLVRDESTSAGKGSAHMLLTPFVADVLGSCGTAAQGSRRRSHHSSRCTADSLQEQQSRAASSSWDQVEAAVAEWRQQQQQAELQQQQQQLLKRQGSLAKQVLQRKAAGTSASRTYSCPNKLPSSASAMSLSLDTASLNLVGGAWPAGLQHQRGKTPVSSPTPVLHTAGPTPSVSRTASSAAGPTVVTTTVPCCSSCSANPVVVSCAACGCMSASPLAAEPESHIACPLQGGLEATGCAMHAGSANSQITPMLTEGNRSAAPQLCAGTYASIHEPSGTPVNELLAHPRRASNGGNSTVTSCSSNAPAAGPVVEQYVQGSLKCAHSNSSSSSSILGTWMAALGSVNSSSVGRQMSKLCKASSPAAAELVSCYEREQMASNDMQSQSCATADSAGCGEVKVTLAADIPGRVMPAGNAAASAGSAEAPAAGKQTPQPGSSASGGRVLRSLVRHLSLPIGKAPATPSVAASAAAGSGRASLRLGRGARSPSCCSSGAALGAAPGTGSSGAGGSSIAGSGTMLSTQRQQQEQPAAAGVGGRYEFYSLPGQQLHQQLHHKKREQHPLASLKVMLNQMREASDAIEEQQQHAVLIANMASRQHAAIAGKALQSFPPASAAVPGASGAVRCAVGAARLNRTMSLDSREHIGAHSNHQMQRQMSAVGAMQHIPFGVTCNSCSGNGPTLQVLQQLQFACPAAAAAGVTRAAVAPTGVPPRPSVDPAAMQQQQQQRQQLQRRRQGRSSGAVSSLPCMASQRAVRLTAELLAQAAAVEARIDEDCYSSKYGVHGRVRRPSADNLRGSGVSRGTAASAAVRRTSGADCGLGMQDACPKKLDSGSSCRPQSHAPSGSGTGTTCVKGSTGSWALGSALNIDNVQGISSGSRGSAGFSRLRTQHWLQQQQQQSQQAGRPPYSGGVKLSAACSKQQHQQQQLHASKPPRGVATQQSAACVQQQQQLVHQPSACMAPSHDMPYPTPHIAPTAFAASASKEAQRTDNNSAASTRRGRNGLVLERLGSKAAALKQLYVLQSNPDAVGELVQSLKAWHAGPEAAAAAKVAAKHNSDA